MKIVDAYVVRSHIIETDLDEYPTYRRNSAEGWEQLMGESWETIYGDHEKEMEEMFQRYMKEKK